MVVSGHVKLTKSIKREIKKNRSEPERHVYSVEWMATMTKTNTYLLSSSPVYK